MPMINIEYDDAKVSKDQIQALSQGIQKIVSDITDIKDVFVYANSAQIKVQIAPIEIFVRISSQKIADIDELTNKIREKLKNWKQKNNFDIPINLTIIPMNWKVEIGI